MDAHLLANFLWSSVLTHLLRECYRFLTGVDPSVAVSALEEHVALVVKVHARGPLQDVDALQLCVVDVHPFGFSHVFDESCE